MFYPYKLVTPSSGLVVSLVEIKQQLRLDAADTSQDTFLTQLINVATQAAEFYTRRDFLTKTYTVYRDKFDTLMELRRSPLIAISSVYYDDINNVNTLLSSSLYTASFESEFSYVVIKPNQSLPIVYCKPQAVRITFTAGYGVAADVPIVIRQAITAIVAGLYENRGDCGAEASTIMSPLTMSLLNPYKIMDLAGYPIRGPYYDGHPLRGIYYNGFL